MTGDRKPWEIPMSYEEAPAPPDPAADDVKEKKPRKSVGEFDFPVAVTGLGSAADRQPLDYRKGDRDAVSNLDTGEVVRAIEDEGGGV